jgi:hypothetical protein
MEIDGDNFTIVTTSDNLVGTHDGAFLVGSTGEAPYVEFFAQRDFFAATILAPPFCFEIDLDVPETM